MATIDYDLYTALLDQYSNMSAQTRRHYATTLLAMLKRARAERVIKSHQLSDIILPPAPRNGDPQPWTRHELGAIMGPALVAYEADQAAWNAKVAQEKKNRGLRSPSVVPLRGYCLISYYTMMRPDCNLHLRWGEVTLNAKTRTGWYKLDQDKNVNKGIKAEGPLAEELVDYLLSIRPANPGNGYIHFNPETGRPYVDIRKQWERLMRFASRILGYDLEDKKRMFFNFRHTGASHDAQRGKTPAHLLAVVQMMGDTSVATVNRHYFRIEPELMRELLLGWKRPDVDVRAIAAADLFGAAERICEIELRSRANARPEEDAMPKRRAQFLHRYTTVHLTRDGKRVPFVRLSGRWLEALGFKEGAKFAAVGVEGGLLVVTVYEAAPDGRTSRPDTSRAVDAEEDAFPPRNRA